MEIDRSGTVIDRQVLTEKSVYGLLRSAGTPERDISHHFSDLYVRVTPRNTELLRRYYEAQGISKMPETFRSNIPGEGYWYDIPFAYDPYWEERMKNESV